jgi:hypothetical protein
MLCRFIANQTVWTSTCVCITQRPPPVATSIHLKACIAAGVSPQVLFHGGTTRRAPVTMTRVACQKAKVGEGGGEGEGDTRAPSE